MSPNTAKFRAEMPLTERWLARTWTEYPINEKGEKVPTHRTTGPYRNPKRAAAKAARAARLESNRAYAKARKPYRGPRGLWIWAEREALRIRGELGLQDTAAGS